MAYSSKQAAQEALKGKNQSEKDANSELKKNTVAHAKSTVSGFTMKRASKVGSGDFTVELRWKCSTAHSQLADQGFELDIEQYDKNTKKWSEISNAIQKHAKTGNVKEKDSKGKTVTVYVYRFTAPSDTTITDLRARIRPVSGTKSFTAYYWTVKKNSDGTWGTTKTKVTKTLPYFTETAWSDRKTLDNPAYMDALDEKERLKRAAPEKPGVPKASLTEDGYVLLEFDAVDKTTADTCRLLYRCADGAYSSAGKSLVGHSVIKGETTSYLDTGVEPGHEYRYYARAHNSRDHDGLTGTWDQPPDFPDDLSGAVATPPVEVSGLTASAYSSDSVRVTFAYPGYAPAIEDARVYYSDDLGKLTTNRESCQSASVSLGAQAMAVIIDNLDAGKKWYFGVWLKTGSDSICERFCDSTAECMVATAPDAPTILDLPRSACIGDGVEVEWLHNSTDGSQQTRAVVEMIVPGYDVEYHVEGSSPSKSVYLDPSKVADGATVTVRVRTAGASGELSPAAEGCFIAYRRPVASLAVTSPTGFGGSLGTTVTSLPIAMRMSAGAQGGALTQSVVQWRLALYAAEAIGYTDLYGNDAVISAGEKVLEIAYDSYDVGFSSPAMDASIPATSAVFVNGAAYRLVLSALMDSGLEADEDEFDFTCDFGEGDMPAPTATVEPRPDWSAAIYPACAQAREVPDGDDYVVDRDLLVLAERDGGPFTVTASYTGPDGAEVEDAFDWDGGPADFPLGEWSEFGAVKCDGAELSGEAHSEPALRDNVLLSVYRVGHDGVLTQVGGAVPNADGAFVIDRHPSFGTMSYRVIANDQSTDEITACDVAEENGWAYILIQWNEGGVATGDQDMFDPDFEFVMLPYNVTVRQQSAKDVALKSYVGRPHPVALHGTQVGETGSWSCQFPKRAGDAELAALRRLAAWMGTCWVRESSGLTYPAAVDVTITRSYDSGAYDVSMEVTRVDGD